MVNLLDMEPCKEKIVLAITFFLISFVGLAESGLSFEQLKEKYSKYNAVVTELEYYYCFDITADTLNVSFSKKEEITILNEHSKSFTNDYISYNYFTSLHDVEAYTLVPSGKKYDKVNVELFQETSDISAHVFYDDSKALKFSYPSIQKGAKTHLEYTLDYSDPRLLRKSFFQSFIPIVQTKVTAKVHNSVLVDYKLFNAQDFDIGYSTYTKGKYTYHEWLLNEVEPFKYGNANSYNINYHSPHIVLSINETSIKGNTEKYFGDVNDLYKYYCDFISQVDTLFSSDLRTFALELTSGLSDKEKARKIYYWVQTNIKYVAYEQGYMGFVPASANEVFEKRFGDCKGMSSLLKAMMNMVGLNVNVAWVGTRHIPYSYNELPLPLVDNHMVAVQNSGDSLIVLDGTFNYLDYGVYPYHIQGKEVLVANDSESFEIFKVPISSAEYSTIVDSISIQYEDDLIIGEGKVVHTGFYKLELANFFDGLKETRYNKHLSYLLNKGNNKFEVDSHRIYNIFEYDAPAEIDYEFVLHDYSKQLGDELYINMNLDRAYEDFIVDLSGMISPIENDFYCSESMITHFDIPEGYEATYVPEDGGYSNDEFWFSIKYRKEGNAIIQEKKFEFKFFVLVDDQLKIWNEMITSLNKHYRSSIVLKKRNL